MDYNDNKRKASRTLKLYTGYYVDSMPLEEGQQRVEGVAFGGVIDDCGEQQPYMKYSKTLSYHTIVLREIARFLHNVNEDQEGTTNNHSWDMDIYVVHNNTCKIMMKIRSIFKDTYRHTDIDLRDQLIEHKLKKKNGQKYDYHDIALSMIHDLIAISKKADLKFELKQVVLREGDMAHGQVGVASQLAQMCIMKKRQELATAL